jgi:hypothetical protein
MTIIIKFLPHHIEKMRHFQARSGAFVAGSIPDFAGPAASPRSRALFFQKKSTMNPPSSRNRGTTARSNFGTKFRMSKIVSEN